MAKRRRMTAKQRKYFGGHRYKARHYVSPVSVPRKRRYVSMARYRRYRGRSGRSRGIGGMKGLLAPILAGVGENVIDGYLPIKGVAPTAVGMFMHNETLKTLGLYQVGYSLGGILPIPGISKGGSGGFQ